MKKYGDKCDQQRKLITTHRWVGGYGILVKDVPVQSSKKKGEVQELQRVFLQKAGWRPIAM